MSLPLTDAALFALQQPGLFDGSEGEVLYAQKGSQDFPSFFADQGYSLDGSSGVFLQTDGFGGIDLSGNLTVDGNIDLADHYFLIDSTTGYITSSQGYVPFDVVVEALQGLSVANGLAFDSINSTGSPCDISAATVAGNLMSGLFDGSGNFIFNSLSLGGNTASSIVGTTAVLITSDESTSGIAAFQSDGSLAQATAVEINSVIFTSDTSHFVDGTGAFQTISSIGASQKLVSNSAPTTGQTVSAAGIHQDELIYVQPAGTLLALTIQLEPGGGVIADIGDVKEIFISQIITGLTVSATGGTVRGTALTTSSAVNGSYEYIKVTSTDWLRIR